MGTWQGSACGVRWNRQFLKSLLITITQLRYAYIAKLEHLPNLTRCVKSHLKARLIDQDDYLFSFPSR